MQLTVDPARLVTGGTGTNPVYELLNAATAPNAAGANWQAVPVGAGFGAVNNNDDAPFVYGGRQGGVDNPEVPLLATGCASFHSTSEKETHHVSPISQT